MKLSTYGYLVMYEMPEDAQNILLRMACNTEVCGGPILCWISSWKQSKILQGTAGGNGHLCTTSYRFH